MSTENKVGKCEACENLIYENEEYLVTEFGYLLCNAYCLEKFMIKEQVIHKVNDDLK